MLSLTLACAFLACAQPLPTTPDDGPLLAPVAADIKLTYICGNSFRVRNTSPDTVTVRYDVYGTTETGPVFLAGKPAGAAYSETYFTTVHKGTVRVFLGTQLVQTKANGNLPACTLPSTQRPPIPNGFVWPRGDTVAIVASTNDPRGRFYRTFVMAEVDSAMSGTAFAALLVKYSATVAGGFPAGRLYVLRIPDPGSYDSLLAVVLHLRTESGVVSALGAEYGSVADSPQGLFPDDGSRSTRESMRSSLVGDPNWSRVAIRAPLAWGCETGSSTSPVAVGALDYLFDPTDPDLDATGTTMTLPGQEVAPPLPGSAVNLTLGFNRSHGNGVAGVMAAKGGNGAGVAGLIWNRELHLYPLALGNDVVYNFPVYLSTRIVPDLINNHVKLLVASLTFGSGDPLVYPRIESELARYLQAGGVLVFATDNVGGSQSVSELANSTLATAGLRRAGAVLSSRFPGQVWFVAGTDRSGQIWANSTRFPGLEVMAAPAVSVLTLGRPADWGNNPDSAVRSPDGVSFAAPAVAGAAALLWSREPGLTGPQVLSLLQQGAVRQRLNPFTGVRETPASLSGGVNALDVYGSLQLQSEKAGTPLCGNHLWSEGNTLFAERGSGSAEAITTLPGPIGQILPYHGGRKVVLQDLDAYEWSSVTLTSLGAWTSPLPWDEDSTGMTGSAVSAIGQTHDRDSLAFLASGVVWLGRTYNDYARAVGTLPEVVFASGGGSEVCVKQYKNDGHFDCYETVMTSYSTHTAWRYDITVLGDRSLLLTRDIMHDQMEVDPVWTDCFTFQPETETTGCRFHWHGINISNIGTSLWRMDRIAGGSPDSLADVPAGREVISTTGSEDGGEFAISSAARNLTGDPTNCYTQFYTVQTSGPAVPEAATHSNGSSCFYGWQGGFGVTRQQLTSSTTPSSGGFALQARLGRAVTR